MILDYLILRQGHVDKPRFQRNVESFGKMDLTKAKEAGGREQDSMDTKKLKETER